MRKRYEIKYEYFDDVDFMYLYASDVEDAKGAFYECFSYPTQKNAIEIIYIKQVQ